ncbi:MAG: hypothetical protein AAFN79_02425 [Pseudomonadota bacterium]
MKFATITTLAAALSGFAFATQASDVVILDSTAPALESGALVDEDAEVSIPAGAVVTVILPSGDTKVIDGPYSGALGATDAVESAGLAELTTARGGDTKVLGAVRAPKWEQAE